MFLVNGFALETGIPRIDLPFMQARASKAGPAAENFGRSRYGCNRSAAAFARSPSECAGSAMQRAAVAKRAAPMMPLMPFSSLLCAGFARVADDQGCIASQARAISSLVVNHTSGYWLAYSMNRRTAR